MTADDDICKRLLQAETAIDRAEERLPPELAENADRLGRQVYELRRAYREAHLEEDDG